MDSVIARLFSARDLDSFSGGVPALWYCTGCDLQKPDVQNNAIARAYECLRLQAQKK